LYFQFSRVFDPLTGPVNLNYGWFTIVNCDPGYERNSFVPNEMNEPELRLTNFLANTGAISRDFNVLKLTKPDFMCHI